MDWTAPGFVLNVLITISLQGSAKTQDCILNPKLPGGRLRGCLSKSCLDTFQGLIWPTSCICKSKCEVTEEQSKQTEIEDRQALLLPVTQSMEQLIRNMRIMLNMERDACARAECNQMCQYTFGSYQCACRNGYSLADDGKTCYDTNECILNSHDCSQQCINTVGSYRCGCSSPAFRIASDGKGCLDVNECITGQHTCTGETQCVNTVGSYRCLCPRGLRPSRDGTRCFDINECIIGAHGCEHQCLNIVGSYRCRCNSDFELLSDGRSCRPVAVINNNFI